MKQQTKRSLLNNYKKADEKVRKFRNKLRFFTSTKKGENQKLNDELKKERDAWRDSIGASK